MVDATVNALTQNCEASIKCAVYCVEVERGGCYGVLPPDTPLVMPGETSLSKDAETQRWAWVRASGRGCRLFQRHAFRFR